MIGQKEMLDIIATEAVEGSSSDETGCRGINYEGINRRQGTNDGRDVLSCGYDLRLVIHPDGRYEWID